MAQPKHIPMIFNQEMVLALLSGKKTVTRRHVKRNTRDTEWGGILKPNELAGDINNGEFANAYIQPGDLIWVRETWGVVNHSVNEHGEFTDWTPDRPAREVKEMKYGKGYYTGHAIYRADGEMAWCDDYGDETSAWKPSIHMPKAASRLTLRVKNVTIEKLKEITDEQAVSEGMPTDEEAQKLALDSGLSWYNKPVVWFKSLWNQLYGDWDKNPWVWCIEFEVIEKNVELCNG